MMDSEPGDIGLIYMNARYYVPTLNRFLSADSIVPNAKNPQSYNRYSYAYNNPIRFFDPTGRYSCNVSFEEHGICVDAILSPEIRNRIEDWVPSFMLDFPVCQQDSVSCVGSSDNVVYVDIPLPTRDTTRVEQWISGGLDLFGTYLDVIELNISIAGVASQPLAGAIGSVGGPAGAVLSWLLERFGADAFETLLSTPAFLASLGSSTANGTTYIDQELGELVIGQALLVNILEMVVDLAAPASPDVDAGLNTAVLYYDVMGNIVLDKILYPIQYDSGFNLIQLRVALNSNSLKSFYWVAVE